VLPAVRSLLTEEGRAVALVKPQFEAGRDDVPRGGVIRNPVTWERVLREVAAAAWDSRLHAVNVTRSPVEGTDGNVEFLMDLRHEGAVAAEIGAAILDAIEG
jgi:23S rRNA (cytidine1920-2'-O)/16S rRNA (cytidine1409-2'-O)-methyltransferase